MSGLFVTTSTFFPEKVMVQAPNDVISDWLREHGQPGDLVEFHESFLHHGIGIIIRHNLAADAADPTVRKMSDEEYIDSYEVWREHQDMHR